MNCSTRSRDPDLPLVVAIGNPLRGDDGVAWHVAETIRSARPEAVVVCRHQLVPELADPISRSSTVVFVDAAVGTAPGRVQVARLQPGTGPPAVGHAMGPAAVLALTSAAYGRCPEAFLVAVEGERFGHGEQLTHAVAAAVPVAAARVLEIIDRGAMSVHEQA